MDDDDVRRFIAELRARGWREDDGWLYAPHGNLWFQMGDPWHEPVAEFHARMLANLQRYRGATNVLHEPREWDELVSDHESLVAAITAVLDPAHTRLH